MVKSKFLKYFLIFSSVLSLSIFTFFIPVSAESSFPLVIVDVSHEAGNSILSNVDFTFTTSDIKTTAQYSSGSSSAIDSLGVWNLKVRCDSDYVGAPGILSFKFWGNGLPATSSNSYLPFLNVNLERPYTSGEGFSFQLSSNSSNVSVFDVSIPVDELPYYFYMRFNSWFNWKSGVFWISDFNFEYTSSSPSSDDEDILSSFDEQQDEMLTSGVDNVSSYGDEINNSVMSFIQSAPNVLSFVSGMFNRLVGGFDFLNVLIMASLCFAVVPALFGLVTHIVKSVGKFKDD